jgi:hypothetical protein
MQVVKPALHQSKIAGREMAIEIGDESPYLDARRCCQ